MGTPLGAENEIEFYYPPLGNTGTTFRQARHTGRRRYRFGRLWTPYVRQASAPGRIMERLYLTAGSAWLWWRGRAV